MKPHQGKKRAGSQARATEQENRPVACPPRERSRRAENAGKRRAESTPKRIKTVDAEEWLRISRLIGERRHPKVLSTKDRDNFFQKLATAKPSELLLAPKEFEKIWRAKIAKGFDRNRRPVAHRKKLHPRS